MEKAHKRDTIGQKERLRGNQERKEQRDIKYLQ